MKRASACCAWTAFAVLLVGTVTLLTLPLLPISPDTDPFPTTSTVGTISPEYNFTESWKALHFCKAAYCSFSNLTKWACGNACTNATPDFHVFNVYDNDTTGNLGYTGMDHDAERIVVAFRGTFNTANWIQDLDFWSMPYPDPNCGVGCTVHRGFYKAYASVRPQLVADVLAMHERYPGYTLFITGHSLGGAMAVLAAIDFTTWNSPRLAMDDAYGGVARTTAEPSHLVPVELYTFGEPRVGNAFFTNWSTSVLANERQFRVTHAKDPVPHLPPRSWGYVHVPQELWYPTDNETVFLCQDSSVAEDPLCSNSVFATAVADHLLYLGTCTRCECTAAEMAEIYSYEMPPDVAAILALEHAMYDFPPEERDDGTH